MRNPWLSSHTLSLLVRVGSFTQTRTRYKRQIPRLSHYDTMDLRICGGILQPTILRARKEA
jgi:hypothetical protein